METIDNIPTAEILEGSHDHHTIPTAETADIDSILDIGITDDMKQCYVLSRTLRCCVWLECLLAMLAAFSNLYLTIPLLLAYLGYIGARNFNKNMVILYFIYLTANNACRFYIFFHFFLPLTPKERHTHVFSFMLVIICGIMDLITSYVCYLFYKAIKQLPAEDLEFIKLIEDHELRQASMNNSS
jgi:hypothetical protein